MTTQDKMRKAFEADFIGDHTSAPHTLDRSGDGYRFMTAQIAWTTWQRAWTAYPAPMSKEDIAKGLESLKEAYEFMSSMREAITIMQSAIKATK